MRSPAGRPAGPRPAGAPAGAAAPDSGNGPGGLLRAALAAGRFVVTAEIGPPRGADPEQITRQARRLRGWVDAANVTDNQGAHARLSSLAGSLLVLHAGVEPVMQLTCRDRNRLALQSDLLGAGALGIPNVLLLTGDHPSSGDHPDAKPVFDLDGVQLTRTARAMRDQGVLLSGRRIQAPPGWLIGSVENPFGAAAGVRARRLAQKVAAGAEFVQTQYVFDVGLFARWMTEVRDLGITDQCALIAGVGPVRSQRALEFMRTRVPGLHLPDPVLQRLRAAGDRVAEAGIELCVETIQQLAEIPGVAGVHVMAPGAEHVIPDILQRARAGPRYAALARGDGPPEPAAGRLLAQEGRHAD
jgi:methylenetetrahydrofolate reductase (NADPH)